MVERQLTGWQFSWREFGASTDISFDLRIALPARCQAS
jgi:hypothetical protein